MEWIVLAYLIVCLYLYCLLGGADFGAGALEIFFPENKREAYRNIVIKALGPVWEANHIWLIILIVILFNGFPSAYSELSIYFHIPLTLMLVGIIFRGCAFTYRTYDAVKDHTGQIYSIVFSTASILTPILLGMIVGGLTLGRVDPIEMNFYEKFVAPWLNLFSLSVGIFVLMIFLFLAATFLIGETTDQQTIEYFIGLVKKINVAMVLSGAFVFLAAYIDGFNLLQDFLTHPLSLWGLIGATLPLGLFWTVLKKGRPWLLRSIVGFQLAMILLAWLAVMYPNFISYNNGIHLNIFEAMAPEVTLNILGWALIIGSVLFLPALYYLFLIFKIR